MTPRSNFLAMMAGEQWEWMPLDLPMTHPVVDLMEEQTGSRDPVTALGCDFRFLWPHHADHTDDWSRAYKRLGINLPEGARIGAEGYAEIVPPAETMGRAWHLTEMIHPLEGLETLSQVISLPWRDPSVEAPYEHYTRLVESIHQEGLVAVLGSECTVFEPAWYCRSMEGLFEDLILENGIAEWLLDHFMSLSIASCVAAAKAGVDLIRLGDDVGTQRGLLMSKAMWREVLKPRLAKVIASIREAAPQSPPYIQYHSDGDIREIVDDLIEIGVDIINPVQPECMDVDQVVERWKDTLGFSGLIGTQTTMPFGSPQDVAKAVANCRSWARKGAKILVAPTHVLEPDVPWENILTLAREVKA
jgi:uroporphyrinogen decarboxylase